MRATKFGRFAALLFVLTLGAHAAEKATWKPITDAVLRIDDRAPKQWSLYHVGKKFDPLLLQLGSRALVIYVRNQTVYESYYGAGTWIKQQASAAASLWGFAAW